jgi:tetratricopeptide (TPR) repeat protein
MIQREETNKTTAATINDRLSTVRESDLRTRLKTFPRDAQSWYSLGSLLRIAGNLEEAEAALRKAISLNPSPTHFWEELARILMDTGRIEDAYHLYDGSIRCASASIKKALDDHRKIDHHLDTDSTSPCVACPDYSYYGCSKGGTCSTILQWRTKSNDESIQKKN